MLKKFRAEDVVLPLLGVVGLLLVWIAISATGKTSLPTPASTWALSSRYALEPLAQHGPQDQGLLRMAWSSLLLIAQAYPIAILVGTPLGLLIGSSRVFAKCIDPLIQLARPISPLAWLPVGVMLFKNLGPAAIFAIAATAMWPTVANTAMGVRSIPQDYLNVARVLKLSRMQVLFKIMLPATLPYMFTGFRISLGLAWLAIVAAEMLTGASGLGGFLWQEYNSLVYEHIVMCILAIGVVGYVLDRMMSLVEQRLKALGSY